MVCLLSLAFSFTFLTGFFPALDFYSAVLNMCMHSNPSHRRFPKARVWPPLPTSSSRAMMSADNEYLASHLPDQATQEYLLDLYFTHVHSSFPVVHKKPFLEAVMIS